MTIVSVEENEKASEDLTQKGKPGKGMILYAFLFLILAAAAGLTRVVIFGADAVREISVKGNHYLSAEEVIALSGMEKGASLDLADVWKAEGLLRLHPALGGADIRRLGEGRYLIDVRERKCSAIVRMGGRLFEIDDDLHVLSLRPRCGALIVIEGNFILNDMTFSDRRLSEIMEGLKKLSALTPGLSSRISEIDMRRSESITIYAVNRKTKVELSPILDQENIYRLYAALSYLEKEGVTGSVDLRGPDPVIVPRP